MISIERLFELISPRGISYEQIAGRGIFSKEDAMGVIAQAQGNCLVGVRVLEARISGIEGSRIQLRNAVADTLQSRGINFDIALSLAKMVVHEVCGTSICPECEGRGERASRKFKNKLFECKVCHGVGRILVEVDDLAVMLSCELSEEVSPERFRKEFYDRYMECVDELHRSAGDAEIECRVLLRKCAE